MLWSDGNVRQMKSLQLGELLRHPSNIKKLTATGQSVLITDNGKPLWVLAASTPFLPESHAEEVDDEFDAMLAEPISAVSASNLVLSSRR
jgi:hypothetical protein